MSLYNALFGRNPVSDVLLAMLRLAQGDTGRFRDCYLAPWKGAYCEPDSDSPLHIVVFTRNGGGNREDYESVTSALQDHAQYVTDYDDDFDCTYASYVFRVPEEYKEVAKELASLGGQSTDSFEKRFARVIESIRSAEPASPK